MDIVSRCNHCGSNVTGRMLYNRPCPECEQDHHDQPIPCSRCLFLFEEDERLNNPFNLKIKVDPPKAA